MPNIWNFDTAEWRKMLKSLFSNDTGHNHDGYNSAQIEVKTESTYSTAGNLTITSAMVLGGLLTRDPNGGNRTDTLPTAALLVAAIAASKNENMLQRAEYPRVGLELKFLIVNTADAAETITVAAGEGGTMHPTTPTIAQNTAKQFLIKLTNVTSGAEAYDVFAMN